MIALAVIVTAAAVALPLLYVIYRLFERIDQLEEAVDRERRKDGVPVPQPVLTVKPDGRRKLPGHPTAA